jgi:hypothetical protein
MKTLERRSKHLFNFQPWHSETGKSNSRHQIFHDSTIGMVYHLDLPVTLYHSILEFHSCLNQ